MLRYDVIRVWTFDSETVSTPKITLINKNVLQTYATTNGRCTVAPALQQHKVVHRQGGNSCD